MCEKGLSTVTERLTMLTTAWFRCAASVLFLAGGLSAPAVGQRTLPTRVDTDRDGLPDQLDGCPTLTYTPGFDGAVCGPMDLNPGNDSAPECKARERVARFLVNDPTFITRIAFAVVEDGRLHFADAFEYTGGGQFAHVPAGVFRLFRIGSTSKAVTATLAKLMEENGELSLGDFVDDDDGSQELVNPQRTLRHLLAHQGAFTLDSGSPYLFCYPGDLAAFWAEPNDLVSPHYNSSTYGNLGGGYQYSAFNYSLAGAYLSNRAGDSFEQALQTRLFDAALMCTATVDASRAVQTTIGNGAAVAQTEVMHIGPYINLVSPTDPLCVDNYYSSDALYGDPYTWLYYRLDETDGEPRDPPGGVIASVIDLAHFAEMLLSSYHGTGGLLSPAGVRDLWWRTTNLGCSPACAYQPYYGLGFFTDSLPGQPVNECEHGGVRAGYTSAFVLRPEANRAVSILVNGNANSVDLSNLAKEILDDF